MTPNAQKVFHHEVWPEGQGIFCGVFFRRATYLYTGWVVVARGVERPDVNGDKAGDHEGQKVVQREEAVQRGVVHGRSAQQPRLQHFTDTGIAPNRPVITVAPQKDI